MEVVVTNGAIKTCKVPPQQWNTQLFTGQMPFFSPSQQCQGTERNKAQDCIFYLFAENTPLQVLFLTNLVRQFVLSTY